MFKTATARLALETIIRSFNCVNLSGSEGGRPLQNRSAVAPDGGSLLHDGARYDDRRDIART